MTRSLFSVLATAILAACASQPPEVHTPVETSIAPPEPPAIERAFPAESVYPLLMAEFALRRRAYDTALETYLEQSRRLEDVGVARHTTHLAQYVRNDEATLEAVQLWLDLEPDNLEANNTAAILLARQFRPLEALAHMALLARNGVQANFPLLLQGFDQLSDDKRAQLVSELNALSRDFPEDPALLMAQALIHTEFEQYPEAQSKLDDLFAVEPFQHQALLLEARVRLASEVENPFSHIEEALDANPEDSRLRLEYARLLTRSDMASARAQFEILSAENPRDADLLLSLALINREIGDDVIAGAYLRQILEQDERQDEAHYYLGRIAEDRGERNKAIEHYMQVGESRQYMSANQRLGQILISAGQVAQSRAWFDSQRRARPARSEPLYNLEATILSSLGQLEASLEVLNAGIAAFPDSTSLRYTRSMLGEQQDNLALMESDLREILARDPNNATALNALGYTLANKTTRYDEAFKLISRALELDPDEPAILDSMGWVLYRKGQYEEALGYLRRAFALFPDPEVAAHLGEVLWVSGDTAAAIEVWQNALREAPDHPVLNETLQRLGVEDVRLNAVGDRGSAAP